MKGEVTFAPEAYLQLHQKLTENKLCSLDINAGK